MDSTLLVLVGAIVLVAVVLLLLRRTQEGSGLSAEVYRDLRMQNEALQKALEVKERELRAAAARIAECEKTIEHQSRQLQERKTDLEQTAQYLRLEIEQLAHRLFDEKSRHFQEQSTARLEQALSPLRERIREFEANIDRKFSDENRSKESLRKEIEQLVLLSQQLSADARNLTAALKGQSKVQGNWGEYQLEVLLENAGLQRGEHFETQFTFRDEEGRAKRPDFLIKLPGKRHLLIDAKVSLTAYERFFGEEDPHAREQHLRAHVDSLRRHVQELSSKDYHRLHQLRTPDFIVLFVPIDGAVAAAMQASPTLLEEALRQNVVIATTSTLAAVLRIVAHLWREEKQNRSAREIARQSGKLYDKLVAFVEDLRTVGARLNGAQEAYAEAMRKLTTGTRPGDTIIGRAKRIYELGATAKYQLPSDLVEDTEEEEPAP